MINVISKDDEEWNLAVKKLEDYDVFYLREYAIAFEQENPEIYGTPVLFIYENGGDYAVNVAFLRDIGKETFFKGRLEEGKYYDLISPYGYGGFIGNVTDYDVLNEEYKLYCEEQGYISEFVRFGLFSDYYRYYQGYTTSYTHNVIRSLEMPLDEIWQDFKQKVRKNVKRAAKNNLEIAIDEEGTYLNDFLSVYYGTMRRTQAESAFYFQRSFFENINRMDGNYAYFHVRYGGEIISTELVLYGSENCYSFLGGTNCEYFDLRPNDFLKYEIIKWAKEKGLKNFVLGGGYGSDDGIFQYKTCLAPRGVVDFYIGKKVIKTELYDKLCEMRGIETHSLDLEKSGFFPEYRRQ